MSFLVSSHPFTQALIRTEAYCSRKQIHVQPEESKHNYVGQNTPDNIGSQPGNNKADKTPGMNEVFLWKGDTRRWTHQTQEDERN